MNFYHHIHEWFLADFIRNKPDYYQQAQAKLVLNLALLVFVFIAPVLVWLAVLGMYENVLVAGSIVLGIAGIPLIIKYTGNIALAASIVVVIIYVGVTGTFLVETTFGVINIVWYILLILFTLFTLGKRWGIVISIACIIPYSYYILTMMELNLKEQFLFTQDQLIMMSAVTGVGLLLIHYITLQFIKTKDFAEQAMKRSFAELEGQNSVISAQKEEKELMLKEIHHRVKNNMQIINSLLRIQASEIEDETLQREFQEAQNRIFSMALIHEKMYQVDDLTHIDLEDYLDALLGDLINTYRLNVPIQTEIGVEGVTLGTKTLIPLGLIINEIVTNSLEHAFAGRSQGLIQLYLEPWKTGYRLTIGDDGIGLEHDATSEEATSLGMELIRTFVDQLNGTITRLEREGTVYEIHFEQLEKENEHPIISGNV